MGGENEENRKKKRGGNFSSLPPPVLFSASLFTRHTGFQLRERWRWGQRRMASVTKRKKKTINTSEEFFGASASQRPTKPEPFRKNLARLTPPPPLPPVYIVQDQHLSRESEQRRRQVQRANDNTMRGDAKGPSAFATHVAERLRFQTPPLNCKTAPTPVLPILSLSL